MLAVSLSGLNVCLLGEPPSRVEEGERVGWVNWEGGSADMAGVGAGLASTVRKRERDER